MNAIQEILNTLNNDEFKSLEKFIKKRNKRKDVQNISLLNYYKNDDINKIKNQKNNAHYAVRKRFYESLIQFLANTTFEQNNSETNEALKYLIVSQYFLKNNLYKEAYQCLSKAENQALKLEQFNLLNEIYQIHIQYAYLNNFHNLNEYLVKYENNIILQQKEAKLNIAYSLLRKELDEIHRSKKIIDLNFLIKSTMKSVGIDLDSVLTYKSLNQILFIANEYASIHHNYSLIDEFVNKSYQFLESKKESVKNHLYDHIQIVYFIVNYHFRNLKFRESLFFLEEMEKLMNEKKGIYQKTFELRKQLLKALNFHFSGKTEQAIDLIEKLIKSVSKTAKIEDLNELKLTLTMILGQKENKSAVKYLAQLNHSDAWYEKKMGMLWTIRKNMLEILIHTQNENIELALARISSFKRRYKKYLEEVKEKDVYNFALLIEKNLLKPEIINDKTYKISVQKLIENNQNKDPFILSFLAWLDAKIYKKQVYENTLIFINKNINN